ncbi:hypothetical protein EMEDMD4_280053 [Sinorhizobium medicae]|uniref:Uncharacterized protein n=1 Tax=Sinorhizobium medicae TaxID=110321 RepID=A0A508WVU0_9HYPH|nr:hypothetical protein EMEDMD4_280053 [Sinorhizobium medicae]
MASILLGTDQADIGSGHRRVHDADEITTILGRFDLKSQMQSIIRTWNGVDGNRTRHAQSRPPSRLRLRPCRSSAPCYCIGSDHPHRCAGPRDTS